MKKLKVIGYARVSNSNEDLSTFTSIESQCQYIKDWIATNDATYELIEIFIDDGISGATLDRPGLKALLNKVQQGSIDMVLAYKMDRVSRNISDYPYVLSTLAKYKTKIHYTNSVNAENDASGNFMININLAVAVFEREIASERIKDKRIQTLKKGLYPSGQPPIGYIYSGKCEITPDSRTTEHIKFIFKECANGRKVSEISNLLKSKGYLIPAKYRKNGTLKYKQNYYTENKIRRILKNHIYYGYLYRNTKDGIETYKGLHKPIIDKTLFQSAQKALLACSNAKKASLRKRKGYVLKKKLYCTCGSHMTIGGSGKKIKGGYTPYNYYVCSQKGHYHSNCKCNTHISQHILDNVIFSVLGFIGSKKLDPKSVNKKRDKYVEDLTNKVANIKRQIQKITALIKKDLIIMSNLADEAKNISLTIIQDKSEQLSKLNLKKTDLEEQISILKEQPNIGVMQIKASLENFEFINEQLSLEEKIQISDTVIDKVLIEKVKKHESRREFHLKIVSMPAYMEEIGVLDVIFEIDNSTGKSVWAIKSPFEMNSMNYELEEVKSKKYGRHPIANILNSYKSMVIKKQSIRVYAKSINRSAGSLGREFALVKNLSPASMKYLLNMKDKTKIEKVSLRFLEVIAKIDDENVQMSKLKKKVNECK